MSVQTYIDQARTHVQKEQDAVAAKLDAIDEFIDRIEDLSTEPIPSSTGGEIATGSGFVQAESAHEDRCQRVRTIFAETIRPHTVANMDDPVPLLETIRSELSGPLAVALAPTTDASFSADVKRAILSEATDRQVETGVFHQALVREDAHLETAGEAIDDIIAWITEADETPLADLGFEGLQRRHEALTRHRDRCEDLAVQRQVFLRDTTNKGVEIGIRHDSLVSSLYQESPVDHPLLATIVRLDDACAECQRAVRQHLVRRA